jgi:hypothetical protein
VRGETSPKTNSTSFRLARGLFGGVLAVMAVNNLQGLDEYTQYAESKGAPMAETTVPLVSDSLLFDRDLLLEHHARHARLLDD